MIARASSREDIYAAIFEKVKTLKDTGVIKDCSRILQHWEDLSPKQQPFICMVQMPEDGQYTLGSGMRTKLTGEVALVVYVCQGNDQHKVVATDLNNVVDAIEAVFIDESSASGRNTLDGLVHDCRAFGKIELDEGTLGTQAVAIVPVKFLVG